MPTQPDEQTAAPPRLDAFRPTATQVGMVVNSLRDPSRGVEVEQLVVELDAPISLDRLRAAFEAVHTRHDVLRSFFRWDGADADGGMLQEVLATTPLEVERAVVTDGASWLAADRARGFDPTRAPLHRVALWARPEHREDEGDRVVWTFHHAILDGRSYRRVLEEVLARVDGAPVDEAALPSFGDYCRALDELDRNASHAYFARRLEGASTTPAPATRAARRDEEGRVVRRHGERVLLVDDVRGVLAGAERVKASFANVVQAAWAWVLARRARAADVVLATTRAGRVPSLPGADRVIGCAVDTLPLRLFVDQRGTAMDLLSRVRAESLALREHEHTPLTEILGRAGVALTTLVVVERYDLERAMREQRPENAGRRFRLHERSDFPLVLAAYQDGHGARLALEHDEETLPIADAELLLEHVSVAIARLGASLLADDPRPLAEHDLHARGEEALLASVARGPLAAPPPPEGATIVSRLTALGRARRDEVAVRDGRGIELGRRELLERVRRLAGALGTAGVREQEIVFVLLPRSIHWVVSIWASWVAEAIYVPLDPSWPEERLRVVHDDLVDSGTARHPVVIVDASTRALARRSLTRAKVIDIDVAWDHPLAPGSSESTELPAPSPTSDPIAYILYTSGTTGRPKGARISHRALEAHVEGAVHHYGLGRRDRVLQFTALGFDVSIEEVVPTLVAGGRVVLRSEESAHDLDAFLDEVGRAGVTVLNLPSAFLHELTVHLEQRGLALPASVRLVIAGGERPSPDTWQRLSAVATLATEPERGPLRFINAYGPTEVTITSVLCDLRAAGVAPDGRRELPIGSPFGATRAYVVRSLDTPSRAARVPAGELAPRRCSLEEPGELWLAGPQVASGYVARPESTAAAFVPDPFEAEDLDRVAYRTGDLVKISRTGELEFLGRIDRQIKLRGHRIEPAEIEGALLALAGVTDAAVVLAGEAETRALVAFVSAGAATLDATALRDTLARRLPAVMVPARVIVVPELPLAPTGKVDRAALTRRASVALRETVTESVDEPRDDVEAWLRPIFAEVLGRDDVPLDRSFFELGGHSLLAIRLLSRLASERPDLEPTLATLFACPSVRELAAALLAAHPTEAPTLVRLSPRRADVDRELPLFCICGVQLYGPLAKAMQADRPVFGAFLPMEADAIRGQGPALEVRAMARAYVALLRREKPRGPYLLGGVSFGGLLAYEMAQQLTAQGEDVPLVVLFDTILPRGLEAQPWAMRARAGLEKLREGSEALLSAVRRRAARLERRVRALGSATEPPPEDDVLLRDGVLKAAAEAYDRVIAPYPGRVVIFRAREGLGDGGRERVRWDMGWTGLVRADTPVHGVRGDHLGILREPGVGEIASVLRGLLSRRSLLP